MKNNARLFQWLLLFFTLTRRSVPSVRKFIKIFRVPISFWTRITGQESIKNAMYEKTEFFGKFFVIPLYIFEILPQRPIPKISALTTFSESRNCAKKSNCHFFELEKLDYHFLVPTGTIFQKQCTNVDILSLRAALTCRVSDLLMYIASNFLHYKPGVRILLSSFGETMIRFTLPGH